MLCRRSIARVDGKFLDNFLPAPELSVAGELRRYRNTAVSQNRLILLVRDTLSSSAVKHPVRTSFVQQPLFSFEDDRLQRRIGLTPPAEKRPSANILSPSRSADLQTKLHRASLFVLSCISKVVFNIRSRPSNFQTINLVMDPARYPSAHLSSFPETKAADMGKPKKRTWLTVRIEKQSFIGQL